MVVKTYKQYKVTTEHREIHSSERNLPFPAITFCNPGKMFNPYVHKPNATTTDERQMGLTDMLRSWAIDSNYDTYSGHYHEKVSEAWTSDRVFPDNKSYPLSFYNNSFSHFLDRWGYHADDLNILQLKYNNVKMTDFDRHLKKFYTHLGICYTFGAEQLLPNNVTTKAIFDYDKRSVTEYLPSWIRTIIGLPVEDHSLHEDMIKRHSGMVLEPQKRYGPEYGFQIILDVKQDDYYFDPTGSNIDAGIKYEIHAGYEPPNIETSGHFVAAGQRVYNKVTLEEQNMLEKPWGMHKDRFYKFFIKVHVCGQFIEK